MSIEPVVRTRSLRRAIAVGALVLSAGGLIFSLSPASARSAVVLATPDGHNATSFKGHGTSGRFALSQSAVLATGEQRVFAELRLGADESDGRAQERAPIALAVVLDTSGSMEGEKMNQARRAVSELLRSMRDDDEVALVEYASSAKLVQPLARVGAVRDRLIERVMSLSASGGTNIPKGMELGLQALPGAGKGRVRRVVLVSDGIDSGRAESERIARDTAEGGITVSALGIGLDFDESYMGGVARAGGGNFAFVDQPSTLDRFLQKELEETTTTVVESAVARLKLPAGVRLVRAAGTDARPTGDGELEMRLGSLFAGDERRVVLELAVRCEQGETLPLTGNISWSRVGGGATSVTLSPLTVSGTSDPALVETSRDAGVHARATSAVASMRQLEATEAYRKGDSAAAEALIDENLDELRAASAAAPAPAAAALAAQSKEFEATRQKLRAAPPRSAAGNAAAKAADEKNVENLGRAAAF